MQFTTPAPSGASVMPETKEHGMIFQGWGVRAIIDGRKRQTRRLLRPPADLVRYCLGNVDEAREMLDKGCFWNCEGTHWQAGDERLPQNIQVGDTIWVRETWQRFSNGDPRSEEAWSGKREDIFYRADESDERTKPLSGKWRSPIHLPRWASRLVLTVTDVRIQRLHEISEEDAIAEGAQCAGVPASLTNRGAFAKAWNEINGPGSWEANPWIVAYSFTPSPSGDKT
jgi:hypothetical protein